MSGGYDFLKLQSMQELEEISSEADILKVQIEKCKERYFEYSHIVMVTCKSFINGMKNGRRLAKEKTEEELQERYNKNLDEIEMLGGSRSERNDLPNIIEDNLEQYFFYIEKYDYLIPRYNSLLKNIRVLQRKVRLLEFLAASNSFKDNKKIIDKIINIMPTTYNMSNDSIGSSKDQLMKFLSDNRDEVPNYILEYVQVWLKENS